MTPPTNRGNSAVFVVGISDAAALREIATLIERVFDPRAAELSLDECQRLYGVAVVAEFAAKAMGGAITKTLEKMGVTPVTIHEPEVRQ